MFKAKIKVTLKDAVLDPQGKAVEGALHSLKYVHTSHVRIGKYIEMKIREKDEKKAAEQVEEMCKKLLANPVIEKFEYELVK
ncbi:MAG: phosphoribosylformylglycinamidine synthase subunit PurS [Candidatus Margulisbacteria bacterium]|nr:phosphoribosylformylglycinamidine synthase subunit PurS [Candidatus Margulisiibacteriota bacterium]MBU1022546.1 phosphoribosylformylglycinamidine synthase subunit PurS [Candidatus Margulisiibacteriota bacterium]MBU1728832.1 phosphoribosylformylglycinamidine synthase subunit PurS [Candidatus Margulisiibacteriota bacterium]MBU1955798.1 phosphoribosylformylglycinamidine synthase subunit PurS [Candidatus Margulisiibacteriota bacterium]